MTVLGVFPCVCACVQTSDCVCVCVYMLRSEVDIRCFSQLLSLLLLLLGSSSSSWRRSWPWSWPAQLAATKLLSLLLQHWDYRCDAPCLDFLTWVLRIKFMLAWHTFYLLSRLPSSLVPPFVEFRCQFCVVLQSGGSDKFSSLAILMFLYDYMGSMYFDDFMVLILF